MEELRGGGLKVSYLSAGGKPAPRTIFLKQDVNGGGGYFSWKGSGGLMSKVPPKLPLLCLAEIRHFEEGDTEESVPAHVTSSGAISCSLQLAFDPEKAESNSSTPKKKAKPAFSGDDAVLDLAFVTEEPARAVQAVLRGMGSLDSHKDTSPRASVASPTSAATFKPPPAAPPPPTEDELFVAMDLAGRVKHLEALPASALAAPEVRDQASCLLALPTPNDRAACLLRLPTQSSAAVLVEMRLRGDFADVLGAMGRGGGAAVSSVLESGGGKKMKKYEDITGKHKKFPKAIGLKLMGCTNAAGCAALLQSLPLGDSAVMVLEMHRRGAAGGVLGEMASTKPSAVAALLSQAPKADRPALLVGMGVARRAAVLARMPDGEATSVLAAVVAAAAHGHCKLQQKYIILVIYLCVFLDYLSIFLFSNYVCLGN